jgi:hypothetical protein
MKSAHSDFEMGIFSGILLFGILCFGNIWGFWEMRDLLNFSTFFSEEFR